MFVLQFDIAIRWAWFVEQVFVPKIYLFYTNEESNSLFHFGISHYRSQERKTAHWQRLDMTFWTETGIYCVYSIMLWISKFAGIKRGKQWSHFLKFYFSSTKLKNSLVSCPTSSIDSPVRRRAAEEVKVSARRAKTPSLSCICNTHIRGARIVVFRRYNEIRIVFVACDTNWECFAIGPPTLQLNFSVAHCADEVNHYQLSFITTLAEECIDCLYVSHRWRFSKSTQI